MLWIRDNKSRSSVCMDRLVEKWLPLSLINEVADSESGFVRLPKISNLHPWPARRPLVTARSLTLASIMRQEDSSAYELICGLDQVGDQPFRTLFLVKPKIDHLAKLLEETGKNPTKITVLDPMAGGGSIPLESLRLGFRTVAMEYNPVAYIILKATLEYPARYGSRLYSDVKEETKELITWAKEELSKYYAEDALNYIFARGYNCPVCAGLVPIIHSDRLGKDGPYITILADRKQKTFGVSVSDASQGFEKLRCIYCETRTPLDSKSVFAEWVKRHKHLLEVALSGDLKKAKSELKELKETHLLLIKQTREGFKPCDNNDYEAFERAYLDLTEHIEELKEYIPNAPIPGENEVFAPIREAGIDYWYQLFNPRQLLILAKLMKYLAERSQKLINEKKEYGAAISIYLAFGIDKLMNFNNVTTEWDESTKTIREMMDHYARTRKVDLGLEYCELKVPLEKRSLGWVYEPYIEKPTATHGGICPVLKQLCSWLDGLGDRIYVYMADARDVHKILGEGVADVVNVDPPYLNQHYYADFSEFFWQLLRISLRHAIEAGFLFNRDENRGRVELVVEGWSPVLSTVPREGEIISRRNYGTSEFSHTTEWYVEQMCMFFSSVSRVLQDDGLLLLWFTHSNPQAWEGILSALYASGFTVSKVWTVRTEMAERRVAQKGPVFFSSLAIVARKGVERIVTGLWSSEKLIASKQVRDAIVRSLVDAYSSALNSRANSFELLIMTLAGAIAGATKIRNPEFEVVRTVQTTLSGELKNELELKRFRRMSEFFKYHLYPTALYLGSEWLLYKAMENVGFKEEFIREVVACDRETTAYLLLWEAATYVGELRVNYDFAEKISKVAGVSVGGLQRYGLVKKEKGVNILFGRQMFEEARGREEVLGSSIAGRASNLIDFILGSPSRGDPAKAADFVASKMPVGKREVLTALFQLRTAKDDWLEGAGIKSFLKSFVEETLIKLLER